MKLSRSLRKTLEMDPGFYIAHVVLAQALDAKGARDAAIVEWQKGASIERRSFGARGCSAALMVSRVIRWRPKKSWTN